uniref:Uncharacterized protein n=1 Tax=Anguilla anguilla TaxID=7936 RepID=A0A0E9V840_ANGAN
MGFKVALCIHMVILLPCQFIQIWL